MKSCHCHHKGEQRVEALFVDTSLLREQEMYMFSHRKDRPTIGCMYLALFMIVCRLNEDALSIYVQGMAKDKIPRCIFVGCVAHVCYVMINLSVLFLLYLGNFIKLQNSYSVYSNLCFRNMMW